MQSTEINTLPSMNINNDKDSEEDSRSAGRTTPPDSPPVSLHVSPPVLDDSHEHSDFVIISTEEGDQEKSRRTRTHHGRKTRGFAWRSVRDHVKMGAKLSDIVTGKLRLGTEILKKGGSENVFKDVFGEIEGEKLLIASQCYLSTTTGPMAGVLYISTQKVAFYSDKSITWPSPIGELIRKRYKVLIPVNKIKEANESANVDNPAQKYMQMMTYDNFEFWFMGFVGYQKAFRNLRTALALVAK